MNKRLQQYQNIINSFSESKILVLISLFIPFSIWQFVAFHPLHSPSGYGGADSITHFLIARYAPLHPELFFYHWGKPLFTILTSPFTQFGIQGVYIFNIIISMCSCYFAYKTSKLLKYQFSIFAITLTAFAPTLFFATTSSLTEPLFAFIAILSVYLFIGKKYIVSAIVFSLAIFVRTESLILFPLFILALSLRKQWKALPFLFTGLVVFSIAGYPFHKTFFWFFTKIPYSMGDSIYGSGSIFHFITHYKEVFGIPLFFLFLIGISTVTIMFFKKKNLFDLEKLSTYLLIVGIPITFFAAHSWVWYKGIGGSLGLLRVMACIIPLASVVGVKGFNELLFTHKKSHQIIKSLIFFLILYTPLVHTYLFKKGFIFKINSYDIALKEAAGFLKSKERTDNRIFYYDPSIPYYLNANFKSNEMHKIYGIETTEYLNPGDFFVWDAHFGPNEGRTELEKLLQKTDIELIMIINSSDPNVIFNGIPYSIYIFRKLEPGQTANNIEIASNHHKFISERFYFKDTIFTSEHFHNESIEFQNNSPKFYPLIEIPVTDIQEINRNAYIYFECEFKQTSSNIPTADIIFTIEQPNNLIFYKAHPVPFSTQTYSTYSSLIFEIRIDATDILNSNFKCYVYNKTTDGSFSLKNFRIIQLEKK